MITRREALERLGALLGAGTFAPALLQGKETSGTITAASAGEPLTIAHITDTHITDEYGSQKWVSQVFNEIQSHQSRPKLVLHTGDIIMDSVHTERPRVDEYWNIWNNTVKKECSLPIHYAIGNHDVWGTRYPMDEAQANSPDWGKGLVKEQLSLEKTYSAFDAGSWHVIMLDSISPFTKGEDGKFNWIAKLDDQQFGWLEKQLKAIPPTKPVLVGSHIPIVQITAMAGQKPQEDGSYILGPKNMHSDARRLIDLFHKHPNVKLCLSGHTHYQSIIKLNDATYFNAGSVCGVQWRHMDQNPERPGYSIVKLHSDGKFDFEYQNYGWKPAKAEAAA